MFHIHRHSPDTRDVWCHINGGQLTGFSMAAHGNVPVDFDTVEDALAVVRDPANNRVMASGHPIPVVEIREVPGRRMDEPKSRLAPTPNDTVVLQDNNGRYPTTTEGLTAAIEEYLPASAVNLREILAERTGRDVDAYDGYDVARCLIVLASFDYPPED